MQMLATIRHFMAVKNWAQHNGAVAILDVNTFQLEVKGNNRYCTFYPQFLIEQNGRMMYSPELTNNPPKGFIGWRPYRPAVWDLAYEKPRFKLALEKEGLKTPRSCAVNELQRQDMPCLLKLTAGSFGEQIWGPFGSSTELGGFLTKSRKDFDQNQKLFVEEFVKGRILKVWFWQNTPVDAHIQAYPTVCGDGRSTVKELLKQRLSIAGKNLDTFTDLPHILWSLDYQRESLDGVLANGKEVWFDFRYGRQYHPLTHHSTDVDELRRMPAQLLTQIEDIGHCLFRGLNGQTAARGLYSVDGVIDSAGIVWWLEANANPMMPISCYATMLDDLFDVRPRQVTPLTSSSVQ